MWTLSRHGLVLACGWFLLAVAAGAQDLTIVSKITREGAAPQTTTSYIAVDRMRSSQGDQEFMAEYGTGRFTIIDNRKKEYFVITKQDIETMAAQMQAQMKQMEQQMANLPPAVREKMSAMTGGVAQAISVQKGTGGRTIAGYSCQNWVVSLGETMKSEHCLTTELQYPIQAYDAYKDFSSAMARMAGPMGKNMGQMFEKFKELKGVPLATTTTMTIMGKNMSSSTEVTEIKKGPIPASAWELPAGYKKADSPFAKLSKK